MKLGANVKTLFDPSEIQKAVDRTKRRIMFRAGGFVRSLARGKLKKAKKKPLTEAQRKKNAPKRDAAGKFITSAEKKPKPTRQDEVSKPGEPPVLHDPRSPLRSRLLFAIGEDDVVVGPELFASGASKTIEERRPFVGPSLEEALPTISTIIAEERF